MKIENKKVIQAQQSIVWDVTIDVENWPKWSPTFESIRRCEEGKLVIGSSALIKQPGLPEAKWIVTALLTEQRFTWKTKVRGINMVATHELTLHENGTESILGIEMSGFVARLMWPVMKFFISRSLEKENLGLKKWCEEMKNT